MEDTEPINDRLICVTIRGTMGTNIICTYMPPAERQNQPDVLIEDKAKAYGELDKWWIKGKTKAQCILVETGMLDPHTLQQTQRKT